MELLFAITAGALYATGLYMMLRRQLSQLIIGLALLTNGTNVLLFTSGGLTRTHPPIHAVDPANTVEPFADPVPQALILTAIVIGFGVLAFALVLAQQVNRAAASDEQEEAD